MRGNIVKLVFGNGLGQAIQLASLLLFSRIYAPGDFGSLGQVQSYATVAAILCTLQLHLSLPLSKGTADARKLVAAIVTICYGAVLLVLPFALWFGKLYVCGLVLALCVGLSNTFNGYLVFEGSFGNISRFYVFRSIAIVVVQAILGFAAVPGGLVWGAIGGEAITAVYLAWRSRHAALPFAGIGIREVLGTIRERHEFALFGTVQELVSVTAFYAPVFLFARFFGDDEAGQYAMASRLVWAPVILFTGSLAQLIYHEFGRNRPANPSARLLALPHPALYLLLVAAPFGCFALRDLVVLALGTQWRLCADMLPLVVAWGAAFVAATPARAVCRMLRQQKAHLLIDLGMLAGIAAAFELARASALAAMAGIFAVAVLQNVLMIMVAWYAMKATPSTRKVHDFAA